MFSLSHTTREWQRCSGRAINGTTLFQSQAFAFPSSFNRQTRPRPWQTRLSVP